jgi:hypothetical protein
MTEPPAVSLIEPTTTRSELKRVGKGISAIGQNMSEI